MALQNEHRDLANSRKYAPDLNIWDPQPWETSRACTAFHTYLMMGAKRTLRETAEVLGYATVESLQGWCVPNHWVERAKAWDQHLIILRQKAQQDEILEMNRRQSEMFQRVQEIAMDKIELLNCQDKMPTWFDVSSLIANAAKGERVARGTPDTLPGKNVSNSNIGNMNVTVSAGFNLEALSDDELDNMLELLDKIGADQNTLKELGLNGNGLNVANGVNRSQVIDHDSQPNNSFMLSE